jgi:hypothetical protein
MNAETTKINPKRWVLGVNSGGLRERGKYHLRSGRGNTAFDEQATGILLECTKCLRFLARNAKYRNI